MDQSKDEERLKQATVEFALHFIDQRWNLKRKNQSTASKSDRGVSKHVTDPFREVEVLTVGCMFLHHPWGGLF